VPANLCRLPWLTCQVPLPMLEVDIQARRANVDPELLDEWVEAALSPACQ